MTAQTGPTSSAPDRPIPRIVAAILLILAGLMYGLCAERGVGAHLPRRNRRRLGSLRVALELPDHGEERLTEGAKAHQPRLVEGLRLVLPRVTEVPLQRPELLPAGVTR
jgi:hypothetical protein